MIKNDPNNIKNTKTSLLIKKLASWFVFLVREKIPQLLEKIYNSTQPVVESLGKAARYRNTDYGLIIASALVGVIIGLFIVVFHKSMEFAEEAFQLMRHKSAEYIQWYFFAIILIPAIGGLLIGILRKTIFKSVDQDGLETVVKALVYKNGVIDWRNSVKSILFAALSIGSGGGAGREGPTIVLGSSLGSAFAQLINLRPSYIRVLCGSGAAAAISGIFNAPLGGIVFALEALIGDVGLKAFVPLVISSVLATATTRVFLGDVALLITPNIVHIRAIDYIFLTIAGIMSGYVALYFLKTFNLTSKYITKLLAPIPDFLRPAIGGLIAGFLVLLLPTMLETSYNPINYAISWDGARLVKSTIIDRFALSFNSDFLLTGAIIALFTVLIKPISNAVTLASGGSGGTFAPSIKVGAMFGFCFGYVLSLFFPGASPGLFAMVCAAAVLAGTYQIPLAAGIIIFEITRNYELILPLIFVSVLSSFIVHKSKIRTFNPFQSDMVDDENRLHPTLKQESKDKDDQND